MDHAGAVAGETGFQVFCGSDVESFACSLKYVDPSHVFSGLFEK